jgi:hypothetical protein
MSLENEPSPEQLRSLSETRKKGGPRTAAGKLRSRQNALQHGLTSKKLVDDVIPTGRLDDLRRELLTEIAPTTTIGRLLVDEVARHGAMLELGERAELAVLRQGAAKLAEFPAAGMVGSAHAPESLLAGAVTNDGLERFLRYRRSHERALYTALRALRETTELCRQVVVMPVKPSVGGEPAWSEAMCVEWLRQRVVKGAWTCPKCQLTAANWIATRNVVQCGACRRQFGHRSGTVMAGSPLPLATWFTAIEIIQVEPQIAAAELARRLGIKRPATAQSLLGKIRMAIESNDSKTLLVGLGREETPV